MSHISLQYTTLSSLFIFLHLNSSSLDVWTFLPFHYYLFSFLTIYKWYYFYHFPHISVFYFADFTVYEHWNIPWHDRGRVVERGGRRHGGGSVLSLPSPHISLSFSFSLLPCFLFTLYCLTHSFLPLSLTLSHSLSLFLPFHFYFSHPPSLPPSLLPSPLSPLLYSLRNLLSLLVCPYCSRELCVRSSLSSAITYLPGCSG